MGDEQGWYNFLSEFRALSSSLSVRLTSLPNQSTLDQQRAILHECEQTSEDISTLLTTIEPELRHYPYALRAKSQQQMNECRDQFDQQNQLVRKYAQSIKSNKMVAKEDNRSNGVTASSSSSSSSISSSAARPSYLDQRQMLLDGRDMLSEGDASLDNTQRMLMETAEIGTATTGQLLQQREQFIKQRDMIDETDTFLLRSSKTLNRMSRRVMTNKVISFAIIGVLIAIFAFIAWFKYFR